MILVSIWPPIRICAGPLARPLELTGYTTAPHLLLSFAVLVSSGLGLLDGPAWFENVPPRYGGELLTGTALEGVLVLVDLLAGVWSLILVFVGVRVLAPGAEFQSALGVVVVAWVLYFLSSS